MVADTKLGILTSCPRKYCPSAAAHLLVNLAVSPSKAQSPGGNSILCNDQDPRRLDHCVVCVTRQKNRTSFHPPFWFQLQMSRKFIPFINSPIHYKLPYCCTSGLVTAKSRRTGKPTFRNQLHCSPSFNPYRIFLSAAPSSLECRVLCTAHSGVPAFRRTSLAVSSW